MDNSDRLTNHKTKSFGSHFREEGSLGCGPPVTSGTLSIALLQTDNSPSIMRGTIDTVTVAV